MTYTRIETWQRALIDHIEAHRGQPFAWGERDCCAFAADAVRAMTGVDFHSAHRGRYTSALGARRILDETGGVEGIARAAFGEPVEWPVLRRGDVALIGTERGQRALGIVALDGRTILAMGEDEPETRSIDTALMGWRVG